VDWGIGCSACCCCLIGDRDGDGVRWSVDPLPLFFLSLLLRFAATISPGKQSTTSIPLVSLTRTQTRRFDPVMPCPALRFSGVRVRELIVDTNALPISFAMAVSSGSSSGGGKPTPRKRRFETSSRDVERLACAEATSNYGCRCANLGRRQPTPPHLVPFLLNEVCESFVQQIREVFSKYIHSILLSTRQECCSSLSVFINEPKYRGYEV
jgi:hypothetical protein